MKSSLYFENTAQANLRFAALSLALSHRERGLGCRLSLRFRQIFNFVEAPFSDDLLEHHRRTHRTAESKFRPMAARTRVYAANSEATATRPLSLWERVRERAVSRRLTSKSITLSQSLCALKTERSSENGAFEGSRVSAKLKPKLQKIEKQPAR
ncbi:hypothetical protein BCD63_05700 [Neisseria meningitidis]|nr:hypothetical protein [Neisseria meningitidis]